jgi:hypothetical protein
MRVVNRITELLFTSMEWLHFDSKPAKDAAGKTNKDGYLEAQSISSKTATSTG